MLEKLAVSLNLSLFFPLVPASISASVFPCPALCVRAEGLGHFSMAQHTSKHRGCAVTGCCASLSCGNLPCAMRNKATSANPESLRAKLNQFSVRFPWAEGVHEDQDGDLGELCQFVKP